MDPSAPRRPVRRRRRRRRPLAVLALGALLGAGCVEQPPRVDAVLAAHPDPAPSDVVELAGRGGTVRVRNLSCQGLGTGSGTVVDGALITNRHVVQGADRLEVSTADGRRVEVEVAAMARETDLAILQVSGALPDGLAMAPADPAPGDPVTAVGFPGGERLTLTDGEVLGEAPDPITGGDAVLLVSARVRPGSSGGPLLDAEGRLAGVIFALRTADGAGLAIPRSRVQEALAGDEMSVPVAPCAGPSLLEQADELGIGTAVAPRPPQPTVPVACPAGRPEVLDAVARVEQAAPAEDGSRRWTVRASGQLRNGASATVTELTVDVEVLAAGGTTVATATLPGALAPGAAAAWSATAVVAGEEPPRTGGATVRWRWEDPVVAARC